MKSDYLLQTSSFHHLQLTLPDTVKTSAVNSILDQFLLTRDQIAALQTAFMADLENGLSASPTRQATSSMLMINTFVPALQSIKREQLAGNYISLDIGSSNFRVLYTKLAPHKEDDTGAKDSDEFVVKYYDIPAEFRKGSSDKLFNFLADCIQSFLNETIPTSSPTLAILPLGFTFSFPMSQLAIDSGRLTTWTKNFDLPDAVNADIAALLQAALDSRNNSHNVRVVALLNDSTGTLVKGSYIDSDCAIGLILGTGSNACYLERIERIEKWQKTEKYRGVEEVLVNMECGAFGDNGCIDFVRTKYDRALDGASLFPKSFTFEKYLGGQFLGEILRLVLLDLAENGLLVGGIITEELKTPNSIKTQHLSEIEGSNSTTALHALFTSLGYPTLSTDDQTIIRLACARISIRVATLLAAILASLITRMAKRRTVIAVDGSVYRKHPRMRHLMGDFIEQLLIGVSGEEEEKQVFALIEAEDGSGKGAGIAAALASKLGLYGQ